MWVLRVTQVDEVRATSTLPIGAIKHAPLIKPLLNDRFISD
ncbi:hypothetical protein [Rhodopirellula sp. MGV]|nr:hypothetical protein [Rhodopirellula sp. MGV]